MLRYLFVIIVFLGVFYEIEAQDKGFGLGLLFGEPTGISFRRWSDPLNSFDGAIAISLMKNNKASMQFDYVWHKFNYFRTDELFPVFYGLGIRYRLRTDESNTLGIRAKAGVSWFPKRYPVDFFVEAAPVIIFVPYLGLSFDMGAGVRIFFKTVD